MITAEMVYHRTQGKTLWEEMYDEKYYCEQTIAMPASELMQGDKG